MVDTRKRIGRIVLLLAAVMAVIGTLSVPVDMSLSIAAFIFAFLFAGLGLACDPL